MAWSGEGPPSAWQTLVVSSHGERKEPALLGLFEKSTNPIY